MPLPLPPKPVVPVAPAQARIMGRQNAMSQFGMDVQREEVELAKKLQAAGKGDSIFKGSVPNTTPLQQSNLRKNYMNALDLSALPQYSKMNLKVGSSREKGAQAALREFGLA